MGFSIFVGKDLSNFLGAPFFWVDPGAIRKLPQRQCASNRAGIGVRAKRGVSKALPA